MQCCLEPLGQYLIRFLPVQCCPKNIQAALQWILSCAMLSGASQNLKTLKLVSAIFYQTFLFHQMIAL